MSGDGNVSIGSGIDLFTEWKHRFQRALRDIGANRALKTLEENGCDRQSLESMLYHAALWSEGAERISRELDAGWRARKAVIRRCDELRKEIEKLRAVTIFETPATEVTAELYMLPREQAQCLDTFASDLDRFESILRSTPVPKAQHDRAWMTQLSEAFVHIYIEETTGRLFSEEVAVLLEVAAEPFRLEKPPNYSSAAVSRRYRRFRTQHQATYQEVRVLFGSMRIGVAGNPPDLLEAVVFQRRIAIWRTATQQNLPVYVPACARKEFAKGAGQAETRQPSGDVTVRREGRKRAKTGQQ